MFNHFIRLTFNKGPVCRIKIWSVPKGLNEPHQHQSSVVVRAVGATCARTLFLSRRVQDCVASIYGVGLIAIIASKGIAAELYEVSTGIGDALTAARKSERIAGFGILGTAGGNIAFG